MPSGQQYLWRPNPEDDDDPEVWFWTEATLESGGQYWYDDAERISLTDPFAADWEGPCEDDDETDDADASLGVGQL